MEMCYRIPPMLKPTMHKVSPLLRNLEQSDNIYDPLVVSFGPYHCGKPELQNAENYKSKSVELFVSGSGNTWVLFKNKILEIIDHVRSCYLEGSTSGFSDSALAFMMLQDASFLLNFIELSVGSDHKRNYDNYMSTFEHLDRLSVNLVMRDMFLLENQIPYAVLSLMISLRYDQSEGDEMLNKFISMTIFGDTRERMKLSVKEQQQPHHLLDAFRQVLVAECIDINNQQSNSCVSFVFKPKDENTDGFINDLKFRSSTDLKTKGIRFKHSNSYSLRDINFKSFFFHSELQLPHWYVSIYSKVFFSNMIAYENCLEFGTLAVVTSYVSFMKMLIQNVEDVKLLRERNIVVNHLGSDEEALQVFNYLDKFALGIDRHVFKEVRDKIQQHCNSKAHTWMAELIHTYFKSPWTVLALLAAMLLLYLGIVQTYYARNPPADPA